MRALEEALLRSTFGTAGPGDIVSMCPSREVLVCREGDSGPLIGDTTVITALFADSASWFLGAGLSSFLTCR